MDGRVQQKTLHHAELLILFLLLVLNYASITVDLSALVLIVMICLPA